MLSNAEPEEVAPCEAVSVYAPLFRALADGRLNRVWRTKRVCCAIGDRGAANAADGRVAVFVVIDRTEFTATRRAMKQGAKRAATIMTSVECCCNA